MAPVRAFLAVPLPAALQRQIAALQAELASSMRGVRWSRPESIHLTVHFFGDTATDQLEKIRSSMLSVSLRERPFAVDVAGIGAFPDRRRPRVIWVGLAPQEPLQQLHRSCRQALQRAGIATETRPFAPHLTIGRCRERGPDLAALSAGQAARRIGALPVATLVLYESRLHPAGAEHIPLFTVPLQRGDQLNDPA